MISNSVTGHMSHESSIIKINYVYIYSRAAEDNNDNS